MRLSQRILSFSFGGLGGNSPDTATRLAETTVLKRDLTSEELQFAGALLQAVGKTVGTPVVLFAALAGTPRLSSSARRVSEAVRQLSGCRVALVHLGSRKGQSELPPTSAVPELGDLTNWTAEGTAMAAGIRWTGVGAESTSMVPTAELINLFDRLRCCFDVICVDAGEVFGSPTTLAAAPLCSGVVLMVERDVTSAREVERAQRLLSQTGARVLGFAFAERN